MEYMRRYKIIKNMKNLKQPKTLTIFSNGNVSCFDDNGEQINELQQKNTIELYFDFLESKGINPIDIENIQTIINGRNVSLKPFKIESGWNFEIIG